MSESPLVSPRTGLTLPQVQVTAPTTILVGFEAMVHVAGGAYAVTLAASPDTTSVTAVTDADGASATHNITVSGNGHTIDGAATATIKTNGASLMFAFDDVAAEWKMVLFPRKVDNNVPITYASDVGDETGGGGGALPGAINDVLMSNGAGGAEVDTGNFQYNPVTHNLTGGVGSNFPAGSTGSIAFGYGNVVTGAESVGIGQGLDVVGDQACAFGDGCGVLADYGFAFGEFCGAAGVASCAGGNECSTQGASAFAFGYLCEAIGEASFALGSQCTTASVSTGAVACGVLANATRWAEVAFCSAADGAGAAEDFHLVGLYGNPDLSTVNLEDGSGAELTLDNAKSYSINVRFLAAEVASSTCAHEVHELLVTVSGSVVTIVNDFLVTPAAASFAVLFPTAALTIAAAGQILRLTVQANNFNVAAYARVTWCALPGAP